MTLRRKTLLILIVVYMIFVLLVFIFSQTILINNYQKLEEQTVQNNIQLVLNNIQIELEQLASTAGDWAYWDDSYQFVQDGNQDYIDSNLTSDAIANLEINFLAFVNLSGETVYQFALDIYSVEEIPFPEELASLFDPSNPILSHPDSDHLLTGIIHASYAPILFASRPILTSDWAGPRKGTLIFGRYLDETKIQKLSTDLKTAISINSYTAEDLPPDILEVKPELTSGRTQVIPQKNKMIAGYTLLEDFSGKPVYILKVELPRVIYQQGQQSIRIFIVTLILSGIIMILAIALLLEKMSSRA